MAPPAFLLVYSNPGTGVPEEEYHDWYDNEHIPLRVAVPTFLNWTRWKAVDGKKPTWAATYDLTSYNETLQPPYSSLAQTRSEREKEILKNLEVLERGTYEAYAGNEQFPKPSAEHDPTKAAPFVQIALIDIKPGTEEEFNKWYDEDHVPNISKIPGWRRSRRFVLKDWSRVGAEGSKNQTPMAKWLAVHEYSYIDGDGLTNEQTLATVKNEWMGKIMVEVVDRIDVRVFGFHKEWKKE